jgi:hypothetical protein
MGGTLLGELIFRLGAEYPLQVISVLIVLLITVGTVMVKKYNKNAIDSKSWLRLFIFLLIGFIGITYFLYYLNYSSF